MVKDAFRGKKANIGYIVAGYPSIEHTREFLSNLDASKLDLLELGIPYSDPLADGKLIAQASFETAANGVNTDVIFDMLAECKDKFKTPVVFLVYFNIIFAYGVERFIRRSAQCGISGFIIPDLPCEEAQEVWGLCTQHGLDLIPLISVTSATRADKILQFGSGFIYAIGAIGVSGSKRASNERLARLVAELKTKSDLPVAVGFGVKCKQDADEVKEYSDGAIIGTEIVKLTAKFSGAELMREVDKLF